MKQLDTDFITLKGFDRRGCVASINNFSSTSWKCTGEFNDAADFVVVDIYKALDEAGHIFTSKYLPSYDLTGVVLDFDLSGSGFQTPTSTKSQSVPWGKVSYILKDGTSGTFPLNITSVTGGTKASSVFTVTSAGPVVFDRVQLIYLGNVVYDHIVAGGETVTNIADDLVTQINTSTEIHATNVAGVITLTDIVVGTDGNNIGIRELHKNANTTIVPNGNTYLTGGVNPSSIHISLDFTSILGANASQIQEMWLTIAPQITTFQAYTRTEFSFEVTNWSVTGAQDLEFLTDRSVTVDALNQWCKYDGNWNKITGPGWYLNGVARHSTNNHDRITIAYWCQDTHDLYGAFLFGIGNGIVSVTLDGTPLSALSTNRNVSTPISGREKISSSISGGNHTVEFEITTVGNGVTFDYLQATVTQNTFNTYTLDTTRGAADDFDTVATYGVSPLYNVNRYLALGFGGKKDFYGGVFFAHRRIRKGGYFPTITLQISGTLNFGTGFGDGDIFFITISGVTFGAAAYPSDTISTLAERLANGVNGIFVAARGYTTGTPGEIKVVSVSPIYNFTSAHSSTTFSGATFTSSGALDVGNEGIWEIDPANTLTRGFLDYISDLDGICSSNSIDISIAFSQELLAPPDTNTLGGAWIQRFSNGEAVLTATGFGLWGSGIVQGVAGTIILQYGHGYLDGYRWHGANSGGSSYAFFIAVVDADHFTLTSRIDSGTDNPAIGDATFVELQTSQCSFNSYVGTYMANIYAAASLAAPNSQRQLGEIGWWFFNNSTSMAYYDVDLSVAALIALGRPLNLFTTPDDDPSVNGFADANFLRQYLEDYITNVIGIVGGGQVWEVLYPYDVNFRIEYTNLTYPFNIGGRLNNYINTPSIFFNDGGTIQSLLIEALAWGTSYAWMDGAKETIKLPFFSPWNWPDSKVRYLIPWQNYGCPWKRETLEASAYQTQVCYWAIDHIILMGWDLTKLKNTEVN